MLKSLTHSGPGIVRSEPRVLRSTGRLTRVAAVVAASFASGCLPSFPSETSDGGSHGDASDAHFEATTLDAGQDATIDGALEAGVTDARALGDSAGDGSGGSDDGGCASSEVVCNGSCTSLDSVHACGACNNDCTALPHVGVAGVACTSRRCVYECASGYADCADAGNGCATSLADTANCGACGTVCASTMACSAPVAGMYACVATCGGATPTACNGKCVNEQTDTANCGGCGSSYACSTGHTCIAGACKQQLTATAVAIAPVAGTAFSGSVATVTDAITTDTPASLTALIDWGDGATSAGTITSSAGAFSVTGSHTYASPGGVTVKVTVTDASTSAVANTSASVTVQCPSGLSNCGGTCINETTNATANATNCGGCGAGFTCTENKVCANGACACPAGYVACTTSCPTGVSCIKPVALASGESNICALLSTGVVECWGNDQGGVVGNGAESSAFPTPIPVPGLSNVTAIAAGGTQACAQVAGTWDCWGYASGGVIGVPGTTTTCNRIDCTLTPTPLFTATALSTGRDATCAVVSGNVECVGRAFYGEIGTMSGPNTCQGGASCATSPVTVSSSLLNGVSALSVAKSDHSACALTQAGAVVCWGDDQGGQLGPNGTASMTTCNSTSDPCSAAPIAVAGVSNATAVSVGGDFACALLQSGAVECWGDNTYGQLGHAETNACLFNSFPCSVTPLAVTGVTGATAIAVGGTFACALLQSGAVECWGSDFSGELGNAGVTTACQGGTTVCTTSPVAVTGVTSAVAIAAGDQSACAILQNGNVVCWGANSAGQLGNGSFTSSTTPTPVAW